MQPTAGNTPLALRRIAKRVLIQIRLMIDIGELCEKEQQRKCNKACSKARIFGEVEPHSGVIPDRPQGRNRTTLTYIKSTLAPIRINWLENFVPALSA